MQRQARLYSFKIGIAVAVVTAQRGGAHPPVPLTTRNELALHNPSTRGSIPESGRVGMVRQVQLYGHYCRTNSCERSVERL